MFLSHRVVLVTRPDPQGQELCAALAAAGAEPIHFPTIAFAPPPDLDQFEQQMKTIATQDWLIFTSPQAVRASLAYLKISADRPKLAAIGEGTAKLLQAAGFSVLFPPDDWRSEGLLALAEFQTVKNKKISLIRGVGGRELLLAELTKRGAEVTSIIAYQRVLPREEACHASASWHPVSGEKMDASLRWHDRLLCMNQRKIDFIIATSAEAVQNLLQIMGENASSCLYNVDLIVVSERLKIFAEQLGFQAVWVAKNASHSEIINTLWHIIDKI